MIEEALVHGVKAFELGGEDGLDILDGLEDALAEVVALVAVAELDGLMLAGGGAGGDSGAAQCAGFQNYISFHGRIAARIENLAGADGNDLSHIIPRNAVLQPVV